MAFTKRLRDAALPFPTDIPMHDIWIGNVAAFYFNVLFINQTCSYFRRTGNNVSTSAGKSKKQSVNQDCHTPLKARDTAANQKARKKAEKV